MNRPDLYALLAPKEGSKKRRVLDYLLAAGDRWVTGSELHRAFGEDGWAWDGAVAQLRDSLRRRGGDIPSLPIEGRLEHKYRLILPPEPDPRPALAPHLARTKDTLRRRKAGLAMEAYGVSARRKEQPNLFSGRE